MTTTLSLAFEVGVVFLSPPALLHTQFRPFVNTASISIVQKVVTLNRPPIFYLGNQSIASTPESFSFNHLFSSSQRAEKMLKTYFHCVSQTVFLKSNPSSCKMPTALSPSGSAIRLQMRLS